MFEKILRSDLGQILAQGKNLHPIKQEHYQALYHQIVYFCCSAHHYHQHGELLGAWQSREEGSIHPHLWLTMHRALLSLLSAQLRWLFFSLGLARQGKGGP
eukprot:749555-Pelagomonas_calceolata.AAC.3